MHLALARPHHGSPDLGAVYLPGPGLGEAKPSLAAQRIPRTSYKQYARWWDTNTNRFIDKFE
jgi:hypothetical protein